MKRKERRMSWLQSKLRSSFSALLGGASHPPTVLEARITLEEIRQTMLGLASSDSSERALKVTRRISHALDIQSLWFLRGELMALLARSRGEAAALEQLAELSALFDGLLPHGLRSRPSPLSTTFRASEPPGRG